MKGDSAVALDDHSAPRASQVRSPVLTPNSHRKRWRSHLAKGTLYLLLSLLSIPFIYPTIWMILSAFKPANEIFSIPPTLWPNEWTLDGVSKIFTVTPFARQYFNSLYIAVIVTVASIAVCASAGYAFARIKFPWRGGLFLALVSTLMVPGELTIIPIFRWVAELGLMNTHWPLIIVPIFGPKCVIGIFIFRQFFLTLPAELEEAGRLDGLGRLGLFRRIAFPLAGPAIAAVAIMKFLDSFNMYFEPLIYLRSEQMYTVGLGLTQYQDNYGEPLYSTQLGATALTVIPVLIIFLFAQRQFVEGLSRTGIKG